MDDRQICDVRDATCRAGAKGAGDDAFETGFDLFERNGQGLSRAHSVLPAPGPGVCSNACCTTNRILTRSRETILKPILSGMPCTFACSVNIFFCRSTDSQSCGVSSPDSRN